MSIICRSLTNGGNKKRTRKFPAMDLATLDAQLRQAAFDQVNRLIALRSGVLDASELAVGFQFQGERIPLINPQRGIFKPREMAKLLSSTSLVWDRTPTTKSTLPTRSTIRKLPSWPPSASPWSNFAYANAT